ncbi:putative NOL1/NOP2/sun domain protein [Aspergillus avenaceus]|uniref:Putative NOL1/NOP2/sun domain protein n=1 Tax=Aspergillus avenaceus TaxID=36643 RepID=A0A5N6TZG1_ASPAV|nr:putative NOL1/NOP2/sun domain protein [Aspergillus avenaceus]
MSLYNDAVRILTTPSPTGGSFKSRIYNERGIKASPAQIYALIIEASKWDTLLKEVIEHAGILKLEPKLSPLLALLLVHDHLLAKGGIAAPASHPLRQSIERHKTRLKGEFIKARVRRGCATVGALKEAVQKEKDPLNASASVYPRWIRVNNVRTTLEKQLSTTFTDYERVTSLAELGCRDSPKRIFVDPHIPDLVAVPQGGDFTATTAYKNGEIILQDKASCFPAYLLFGRGGTWTEGDLVDGCAAPGNKTTHLASLLCKDVKGRPRQRIYSMDASKVRAKTLQKMVSAAGADHFVTVLPGQDFLALDPEDERFEKVSGLLLDPSCSGSGIIGRDDVPKLVLPASPAEEQRKKQGKKRKRGNEEPDISSTTATSATDENEIATSHLDPERLVKLSNLQTRIVEHAMAFPAATRITYSTCSIHMMENEAVVERLLTSEVGKSRGWRIMRRDEQPEGLRKWDRRGVRTETREGAAPQTVGLSDEELDGCLRCWAGDDEGTGGFFVAGFVRDETLASRSLDSQAGESDESDGDEWDGFSD